MHNIPTLQQRMDKAQSDLKGYQLNAELEPKDEGKQSLAISQIGLIEHYRTRYERGER
jgi:hypothetical protein